MRAKLIRLCEDWQWGSAWRRIYGNKKQKKLIDAPPAPFPHGYVKWINTPEKENDLLSVRTSVNKGVPYGRETWTTKMVSRFRLESTLRSPGRRGRPKKA